jgi:hypothetical protein
MMSKKFLQFVALPLALLALTTATAFAATRNTTPSTRTVNIPNGFGTLVGISPVAARVGFDNGTTQTFSISRHQYKELRDMVGTPLWFHVDDNVLYITG